MDGIEEALPVPKELKESDREACELWVVDPSKVYYRKVSLVSFSDYESKVGQDHSS